MADLKLEFPDGSKKDYKKGITGLEIAKEIGERLAKDAIAIEIDGSLLDLTRPIETSGKFRIITFKDAEGKQVLWHSASHVMAEAVQKLWPDVKLAIGPSIEEGFYYDFDKETPFTPSDLIKIEKEMKNIVNENTKFERTEIGKKEALAHFREINEEYKVEMIEEIEDEKISFYTNGKFTDFCRGPHVPSTGYVKAFKLLKVSGAYWRGSEKNKMLQRIYGIAFNDKKLLKEWLGKREEAEKRNHIKLGKELDLFSMQDAAPGCAFFHPKGMVLWNELMKFWKEEHFKDGYVEIKTPEILRRNLWEQSGHWDHYKENMYFTKIDDEDFAIKPMNCPGGILVYKTERHSYRDLPIKMGEVGTVHRHELSGVLNGLFRVRKFTQDDAHIYCTREQVREEVLGVIDLIDRVYKVFGFEYHMELSTRPDKSIGSDEVWATAEKSLKEALESTGKEFKINEGDGAFYGPKIDFHIKDSLGRTWQCGTVQLDFAMPEKFDLYYIDENDNKKQPVMLHRVVFGSVERFIGNIIEHYGGDFPTWLAPVQVKVIAVSDEFGDYAKKVHNELRNKLIRSELDLRKETVSKKVRDAELQKVPYIINIGGKEKEAGTVAVRGRDGKVKFGVKLEDFIKSIEKEVSERKNI